MNPDGSINTIEGNVRPGTLDTGPHGVHPKRRSQCILGYGAPGYANAPKGDSLSLLPVLKAGQQGHVPAVRRLQGLLRAADPSLTDGSFPLTGAFDAQTVQRVKAFQTAHGLDHDGEVGPKTWRELLGLPHA